MVNTALLKVPETRVVAGFAEVVSPKIFMTPGPKVAVKTFPDQPDVRAGPLVSQLRVPLLIFTLLAPAILA
jgi:hypothetical protein